MTFWPLTNSDFPTDQIFHQFNDLYTELDLHRIMSGFHGAFATDVASQQGTLTLPDTCFRPPFWDLLMLQLLRPNSSNLPCLYSTFHLEYPLVLSRFYTKTKSYATFQLNISKHVGEKCGKLHISYILNSQSDITPSKIDESDDTQTWSAVHSQSHVQSKISAHYGKACRRKPWKTVHFLYS